MSAIDEKYSALSGPIGFLGQPTSPEQDSRTIEDAFDISRAGPFTGPPRQARTKSTGPFGRNGPRWAGSGAFSAIP